MPARVPSCCALLALRWLWTTDLWALADPVTSTALRQQALGLGDGSVPAAGGQAEAPGTLLGSAVQGLELARAVEQEAGRPGEGLGDLLTWLDTFRVCQVRGWCTVVWLWRSGCGRFGRVELTRCAVVIVAAGG